MDVVDAGGAKLCRWSCSENESVDAAATAAAVELLSVLDAAAKRWAASCTLEGKVPALALLKPAG